MSWSSQRGSMSRFPAQTKVKIWLLFESYLVPTSSQTWTRNDQNDLNTAGVRPHAELWGPETEMKLCQNVFTCMWWLHTVHAKSILEINLECNKLCNVRFLWKSQMTTTPRVKLWCTWAHRARPLRISPADRSWHRRWRLTHSDSAGSDSGALSRPTRCALWAGRSFGIFTPLVSRHSWRKTRFPK